MIRFIVLYFWYTEGGTGEDASPKHTTDPGFARPEQRKAACGMDCVIRQVAGHVEVYSRSGVFLFSADSTREAMQELREELA